MNILEKYDIVPNDEKLYEIALNTTLFQMMKNYMK